MAARKRKAALVAALKEMTDAVGESGSEESMGLLTKGLDKPGGLLGEEPAKKTRQKKVDHARVTLHLRRDLVERARGALAYAIYKQQGDIKSLSQLFDRALERELERLREELEPEGGDFSPMSKTPRTGRPQGT